MAEWMEVTEQRIDRCIDGWNEGLIDGWIDGRTEGFMD